MKTFSQLISESWQTFQALLKPFLIGAVIVSAILVSGQLQLQKKAMTVMGDNIRSALRSYLNAWREAMKLQ